MRMIRRNQRTVGRKAKRCDRLRVAIVEARGRSATITPRMPWTVYLLRCKDDTLYTGIARDLDRRVAQHDSGRGAKYTRGRGPVRVIWSEIRRTQGAALRREAEIKRWPRRLKLQLVTLTRFRVPSRALRGSRGSRTPGCPRG
ncbi:MAG: GIY-YIG nuclease family protein [Planctomycetota bacterium]